MEWLSAVNTLIGAAVGIGATTLADRRRWRNKKDQDWNTTRRATYISFLVSTARATDNMRLASLRTYPAGGDREEAIRETFRQAEMLEVRFEITMLAPTRIAELATLTYRRARTVRDILIAGSAPGSPEYREAHRNCYIALQATAAEMRKDLDIEDLDFMPFGFPTGERLPDPAL